MRVPLLACALLLAACAPTAPSGLTPTPIPTREPGVVSVTALLDLSGPRAPSGQPQRNAMQLWLDQNATATVKLRVKFVDVAGSDAKALLELRRAAVEDRADAVVVGVPTSLEGSFGEAIDVAGIPVLLTLPVAEPASRARGRFAFALAPTPATLARALANDITDRGAVAPMLLASDESAAAVAERMAFGVELKRRGIEPPAPLDLTQPGSVARVASAALVARSVVLAGASAPYGDELRAIPLTGSRTVYLSYLTETADVTNLRERSGIVTWPGSKWLATISLPPVPGQRAAFVQAFSDRHGAPSTIAATAFDALDMIAVAARFAPSEIDGARLRLRLETNTFGGVVTRYSFSPARHAGFPPEDLAYLRWDAPRGAAFLAPIGRGADR